MKQYTKPFFEGAQECFYPYESDFLKDHSIFPAFIMDGGAWFYANEIMGKDWNGDRMAQKALDGSLFSAWDNGEGLDWALPYKQYRESKVPAPLERFVWVNRFYYLISLANRYYTTQDEAYIEKWYELFSDWTLKNPYRSIAEMDDYLSKSVWTDAKNTSSTISESFEYISNLVWRDMQVTWRLLSVVHSIAMMADSKTLTPERWETIYSFLKQHANHLLIEGKKHTQTKSLHNHVLQMGTALIYIGCLLPEFGNSEEYIQTGRKIIEIQLAGAIDADGGSDEECPSYNHFIARLYIECYLLLEKNGKEPVAGLLESVCKQYQWMWQMSSPEGRTLAINDAYGMSFSADYALVKALIPIKELEEKTSCVFQQSKCCVLRNENWELYIDGMTLTQVHQHAGRPNFLLWLRGNPIVADSGCCGYDNHGLHKYFLSEWAHNTICISADGKVDFNDKPADEIRLEAYSLEGTPFVRFLIEGQRDGIAFTRSREFILEKNRVLVYDTIIAEQSVDIQLLLHLAPLDLTHEKTERKFIVHELGTDRDVTITVQGDVDTTEVQYRPAVNDSAEYTYSPVCIAKRYAKQARIETIIEAKE